MDLVEQRMAEAETVRQAYLRFWSRRWPHLADDLDSETSVAVWRAAERTDIPADRWRPYLFGAIKTAIRRTWWQAQPKGFRGRHHCHGKTPPRTLSTAAHDFHLGGRGRLPGCLDDIPEGWAPEALSVLTDYQREVVVSLVLNDERLSNVARRLGKTNGAVSEARRRSLALLRKLLLGSCRQTDKQLAVRAELHRLGAPLAA